MPSIFASRVGAAAALGCTCLLVLAGCSLGGDDEGASTTTVTATNDTMAADTTQLPPAQVDVTLTLVASPSAREAYDRLAPMFNRTSAGERVLVEPIYLNALDAAQHVAFGLVADLFAPSSEGDLAGLIESERVPRDWRREPFDGMIANSVVAFVVRSGNPKQIRTWQDLTKEGVRIVVGDPEHSGIARWATLGAYTSALERGETREQARAFLRRVLANVSVEGKSGRESFNAFARGNADVVLVSEADAIAAQRKGSALEYVLPDENILIESPLVVTVGAPREAQAFAEFLRGEEAQRVLAEEGHRPVLQSVLAAFDFPAPKRLARLDDVGPARDVQLEFFGAGGLVPTLLRELGKTGSE